MFGQFQAVLSIAITVMIPVITCDIAKYTSVGVGAVVFGIKQMRPKKKLPCIIRILRTDAMYV